MSSSSIIRNCVVTKVHDQNTDQDHLVAYIESTKDYYRTIDENQIKSEIRHYCELNLASYMIPSIFIILSEWPLNENGKLDRKKLPQPNFAQLHLSESADYIEPKTELEIDIHRYWCNLLCSEKISMTANFFQLGGNSLLLMRLYNYYQSKYLIQNNLNISSFFDHPTIQQHSKLILDFIENKEHMLSLTTTSFGAGQTQELLEYKSWHRLYIDEGEFRL
ncbi:unnamed protein product [Rotaria sordida]|uniref:Carrier domain-containing protein n=1 Tax=Rotaria sordida TaxID=392033 RepID=A0A815J135_9BILA|nr:unnamed protein product [Rotaria sordida]CAF1476805.1 unnamed protein product [Rotaria sordida]CAF3950109.1 unnamed protein product [Rotaria sordida]